MWLIVHTPIIKKSKIQPVVHVFVKELNPMLAMVKLKHEDFMMMFSIHLNVHICVCVCGYFK